jgi:hypothetical protein
MQLECIIGEAVCPRSGEGVESTTERNEMIEAIAWAIGLGIPFVLAAGLRRFPWRYCALAGLGIGLIFWAGRLAIVGVDPAFSRFLDPGTLVLVGALGGGLVQFAFDRGERARQRRTAAILGMPSD